MKQIWLDGITEEDIPVIEKAIKVNYFGYTLQHILEDIGHLRVQLWIHRSEGKHFCVLTRMTSHPAGRELNIWSVGGKGYIKALDLIYDKLKEFAIKEECRWITGYVDRRGFSKLYEKFKPKKYGLWIKEI